MRPRTALTLENRTMPPNAQSFKKPGIPSISANPSDRPLRATEVAQVLAISTRLVWRFRSEGKLPSVQIAGATRFRQSDVERLIVSGTEGAWR